MQNNKLAIYMRLSKEDGEAEESFSISNQRYIIENYIKAIPELNCMEKEEYIDDGYSGTNIKRPALTRLLQDIQKEKINCIIVKDLSRFMRNHILQGQFLEILFPMIPVRFISVTDGYDNKEKTKDTDIVLPIKGLTHELYARDLSKKVKSIKQNQIKNGVLKVSAAPYGYVLDSSEKTYKIDQEAANIVKQIYALALEGKKCIEIARILNQEKVLSPGVYKRIKGINQASKKDVLWNSDTIRRILRNEVYTGTYVLGKRKNVGFGINRRKRIPKDQQYFFPEHHEAIVTQEDFKKVQEIRNWRHMEPKNKTVNGILNCPVLCGHCGYALRKIKQAGEVSYFCRTPALTSECSCMTGRILEKDILKALTEIINVSGKLTGGYDHKIEKEEKKNWNKNHKADEQKNILLLKSSLYEQYKEGKISKQEFLQKKAQYETEEKENKQYETEEKENNQKQECSDIISNSFPTQNQATLEIKELNGELIKLLVEKITIYSKEKIKFTLK